MNTKGEYLFNIIKKLAHDNIKLNITAIFTFEQVRKINKNFKSENTGLHINLCW